MALRQLLLLVLGLSVVRSDPEETCSCLNKEGNTDPLLWKFLEKLSVDVPEEEVDMYTVLTGELSPLVECDCGRKRRDLSPNQRKVRTKKSLRYHGICPAGMVRYHRLCVSKEYFEYYDD